MATVSLAAMPGILSAQPDPFKGETVRLGLIGTGAQGRHHIGNALELPGVEVGTLCDVLPFQLDAARSLAGRDINSVSDYRYMLDDPDIDAVIIATPFHFHAQPMLDALDAGKHVYCEKTLVKGYEQIEQVARAAAETDRIIQAGYQHRYSDHLLAISAIIESGSIGEISKVECQWNRNTDWRRPVPSPEFERAVNWRMYREFSGGLVAELSSHQMDILDWILKSRPREIMCTGGIDYWKDGRETRDNTHVLVRYENDVVASFTCLTTNAHEGFRMVFLGTKGTIITSLDDAWISAEELGGNATADYDATSGATMTLGDEKGYRLKLDEFKPTRSALAAFRESIIENRMPAANIHSALASARTVQLSLDAMDNQSVETF